MKYFIVILVLVLSFQTYSQQESNLVTDISPDGKITSTYKPDSNLNGVVQKIMDDIPFGTAPDWTSALDRQIGGMAWADYDNDGDLDLATGCYFSNSFPPIPDYEVLIYNNMNGMLDTLPAWISSDERSTTDLRFGDLNNDGRPELLAANGDNSFVASVIYFNETGGLNNNPGWISQDNNWTVGAAFSDINNDGYLDLAFGNQGNSVVPTKPLSVFINNQTGSFPVTPDWLSADEMITNSVAFGDLDNQQIVSKTLNFSGDGIKSAFPITLVPVYSIDSVLINNQQYFQYCYDPLGGWISLGTKPALGSNVRIVYKYVSQGDLAVSKWVNYESGIYYNNNGTLNNLPGWTVNNTQSQKGIVWTDFDKDGFMDLAISGSSTQTVIYKNNNGILTGPIWSSNSPSTSAQDLIAGDLDHDGYPELAVVNFGNRRVEIFKNRNGALDSTASWVYIAGSSATSISFGDLNGDGSLDLAVGTARSPVVVFLNQSPPVPVELISFSALSVGNKIQLSWSTSTEVNNQGFQIERKNAGEEFNSISFVEGFGTTTQQQNYSFTDKNVSQGKYFYRLKQIDFDGTFEYSNIVEVDFRPLTSYQLEQNYPNPFNPVTKIKYQIPESGFVSLKVYNVLGKEISTLVNEKKPAGFYEIEFDGTGLGSGVYLITLESGNFKDTRKMILLK